MKEDIDSYNAKKLIPSTSTKSSKERSIEDELLVNTIGDSTVFLLPENQISVEIVHRPLSTEITKDTNYLTGPLYLSTCFEEFSRKYLTVSVGKDQPSYIDIDKNPPDLIEDEEQIPPQILLKCYSPGYDQWMSTFRRIPEEESRHLLCGEVLSDSSILIKFYKCQVKQKLSDCFEPIFGTACLFAFIGDEFFRVSESFYFDATPSKVRQSYGFLYDSDFHSQAKSSSHNIGDATGEAEAHMNFFLAQLPEQLRNQRDVYLVIQLSKVLTSDADKAIAPYFPRGTLPDITKQKEAIKRLHKFRQPLGFAVTRIFGEKQITASLALAASVNLSVYAQKVNYNDATIAQIIREMFPFEGKEYFRTEELDIKLSLLLYDSGTYSECNARLREFGLSCTPHAHGKLVSPAVLVGPFTEAQPQSEATLDRSRSASAAIAMAKTTLIRKVLPLIPTSLPWASNVSRQIRTKIENVLYAYIIEFDRFQSSQRNLCSKVELVEIQSNLPINKVPNSTTPHNVLCNIYNHTSLYGPALVPEAYSQVSYHTKNPSSCDEFKIKLPEVLTTRHWLKFTLFHIHVKPQAQRSSILPNMMRSSFDKPDLHDSVYIGTGFMPIYVLGESLIEDSEHEIAILGPDIKTSVSLVVSNGSYSSIPDGPGLEFPTIRVKTRAISSLYSTAKQIQTFFNFCPRPLGTLVTSTFPDEMKAKIYTKFARLRFEEDKIASCCKSLVNAPKLELSRHFLMITRLLTRIIQGGNGCYTPDYSNPYKHAPARCNAFITLIRIIEKVFGGTGNGDRLLGHEVLEAFVDLFIDEEVAVYPSIADLFVDSACDSPSSDGKLNQGFELIPDELNTSTQIVESGALKSGNTSAEPLPIAESGGADLNDAESTYSISDDEIDDENHGEHRSRPESALDGVNDPSFHNLSRRQSQREHLLDTEEINTENISVYVDDLSLLDANQDDILDHLVGFEGILAEALDGPIVSNEAETIDTDEQCIIPRASIAFDKANSGRQSWGSYITDSMWSTGKLIPFQLLNTNSAILDPSDADKYLEGIVDHLVSQALRVIEESMVSIAVVDLSTSIIDDADSARPDQARVTQQMVLQGRRYRFNGAFDDSYPDTPFRKDSYWFRSVDKGGDLIDEDDLFFDEANVKQRLAAKIGPPKTEIAGNLQIEGILPLYDSIEGFQDRDEVTELTTHWWAWLYESLVYQWAAALTCILLALGAVSPNNLESIIGSYPCESDIINVKVDPKRSIRILLLDHGPTLLQIIHKSLAFRIQQEGKAGPVLLDDQFLSALENLVMLLSLEIINLTGEMWIAGKMAKALSAFLRSLFALVVPSQVLRLLRAFFITSRKGKGKADDLKLKLWAIEEISYFDHFVSINFPYTLDAPLSLFAFSAISGAVESHYNSSAYNSSGIRSQLCPPSYSFSHLLISELIPLTKPECPKKEIAWQIIRDLLVRHCYDLRYQSIEAQQRIVCMYLPLFTEICVSIEYIKDLKCESTERKEALSIFAYIAGGMPQRILRNKVREMCLSISNSETNKLPLSMATSPDESRAPRVISLRQDKHFAGSAPETDGFISSYERKYNDLFNLFLILHSTIDTFEYFASSESDSSGIAVLSWLCSPVGQLFAPGSEIRGEMPSQATTNTPLSSSKIVAAESSSSSATSTAAARGSISSSLGNLDQLLQSKKGNNNSSSSSATRRTTSGISIPRVDDHKWVSRKNFAANRVDDRPTSRVSIERSDAVTCAQNLSVIAIRTVLHILWVMIDECPSVLDSIVKSGTADTFVVRESNIDESMLINVSNFRLIPFLRMSMTVLLHALNCNQTDEDLVNIIVSADSCIRRFGARLFLLALEDSLQFWMSVILFHMASINVTVRDAACNMLITLLRSSYCYLGNFTLVSNTILAVIGEVQYEILEHRHNKNSIKTPKDVDFILGGLLASVSLIKQAARRKIESSLNSTKKRVYSYCCSIIEFMNNLETVLTASSELRRYVAHPILYDFYGGNMLDGPFDDRMMQLMHSIRAKRTSVKAEGTMKMEGVVPLSKSGFEIEEIMMHFVQAAEIYDPLALPRFHIQWLENLARLHDFRNNKTESAEIRWRIFTICREVEHSWPKLWAPRPPLGWLKRVISAGDRDPPAAAAAAAAGEINPTTLNKGVPAVERNFFDVLSKSLDAKPFRPWMDHSQYWTHMETSLSIVIERHCMHSNLIHLAERASAHLINLYRLTKKTDQMVSEYNRISNAIKLVNEKGITTAIAMGTFYRVLYSGEGVPAHLRDKEYIFRNATHLHVSEFHALVVEHVKSIVKDAEVRIVQDNNAALDLSNPKLAFVVMNSVKLLMNQSSRSNVSKLFQDQSRRSSSLGQSSSITSANAIEDLNQVVAFQYSVPFTQDGSRTHAKKIDEQWMRTTTLTVKEPFPYILTRQLVIKREAKVLSPIEVALQDIEERIDSMETELDVVVRGTSESNNLMRLIQGTVLPQVNAGAGEVAKVFLSSNRLLSDEVMWQLKITEAQEQTSDDAVARKQLLRSLHEERLNHVELIRKLKLTLIHFLACSKQLLLKARRVLITDISALDSSSIISDGQPIPPMISTPVSVKPSAASAVTSIPATVKKAVTGAGNEAAAAAAAAQTQEANNIKWQIEMEKGYEVLLKAIYPYVSDLREAEALVAKK